jgi:hypothetical protein
MAEYIEAVVAKALAVIEARVPALVAAEGLEPFAEFGAKWAGVAVNLPGVWVMPVRTEFDDEVDGRQAHQITVKFGCSGASPEEVSQAAMQYMRAIHRAIKASDPADWQDCLKAGVVLRVFVRSHDYGPLFQKEAAIARFPELDLIVECTELES